MAAEFISGACVLLKAQKSRRQPGARGGGQGHAGSTGHRGAGQGMTAIPSPQGPCLEAQGGAGAGRAAGVKSSPLPPATVSSQRKPDIEEPTLGLQAQNGLLCSLPRPQLWHL